MAKMDSPIQTEAQKKAVLSFFDAAREAMSPPQPQPPASIKLPSVIFGRSAIEEAAHTLLSRDAAGRSDPSLYISLSSPVLMDPDFLPRIIRRCPLSRGKCLRVGHVIELPASTKLTDESAADFMRRLSLIASLYLNERVDYEPCVLDTDSFAHSMDGVLYPNYLLFSSRALLISSDGETALYISSELMTAAYRSSFERIHARGSSIHFPTCDLSETFLFPFESAQDDETHSPAYSMTYSPALYPQYTREGFEKYIRPDLPNRAKLIDDMQSHYEHCTRYAEQYGGNFFFCEDGLMQFAADGTSTEMFADYVLPIAQEDRLPLLPDQRKQRTMNYAIVDSRKLPLPKHLSIKLFDHTLIIMDTRTFPRCCAILVRDARFTRLFSDFLQDLLRSDFIYSKIDQRVLWAKARKRCLKPPKRGKSDDE